MGLVSKGVFPLPERGKYRHRIITPRNPARVRNGNDLRLRATQERIGGSFNGKRGWHSRQSLGANHRDFISPTTQGTIPRLDGERETQIGLGILVRAINLCIAGKRGKPHQGFMHRLRRAFKNTSATAREQRIPAKQTAAAVIRQMPERVTGNGHDLEAGIEGRRTNSLATPQRVSHACDRL